VPLARTADQLDYRAQFSHFVVSLVASSTARRSTGSLLRGRAAWPVSPVRGNVRRHAPSGAMKVSFFETVRYRAPQALPSEWPEAARRDGSRGPGTRPCARRRRRSPTS